MAPVSHRCLFVDMNAFFASVEQQENPALRGRPIIVAPLLAETTCAIAASYEARAFGIKTGTKVRTARRLCPEIEVVEARPPLYKQYHHKILTLLEKYFVHIHVLSVDEMACGIGRLDATSEGEVRVAQRLKQDIYTNLGSEMRCSIGIAPNVFLAKVAGERQKPDGLTVFPGEAFRRAEMPEVLRGLDLLDLPGIAGQTLARLDRSGIRTVEDLWRASALELRRAWGSVVGERWWHMLRGSSEADYGMVQQNERKSVGHSHVLPPEFRTAEGVRQILMRLFSRCMKRLRDYDQAASSVAIHVRYKDPKTHQTYGWNRGSTRHLHANDDITWSRIIRPLVESVPPGKPGYVPLKAAITFSGLLTCQDVNLSLFEEIDPMEKTRLCRTVDTLNATRDSQTDLASVFWLRDQAPERIPFGRLL